MPLSALGAAALLWRTPRLAALVALGALLPPPGAAVAVAVAAAAAAVGRRRRSQRPQTIDEAAFCAAVAAELRAGATLPHAVVAAADEQPRARAARLSRLARAGAPAGDVARALGETLPHTGTMAALAYRLAADSGAGAVSVFNRLASSARRLEEARRERMAATAQARLSAWVVGGAPVVAACVLAAAGALDGLVRAGSFGAAIAVAGFGLIGGGLLLVWALARGALR